MKVRFFSRSLSMMKLSPDVKAAHDRFKKAAMTFCLPGFPRPLTIFVRTPLPDISKLLRLNAQWRLRWVELLT